ncbi:cytidylyltransferase family-domain-containing protein [Crepidotus variabilis]|uniref:Phosphatidate cytidylyltransferase n=1 Tax=Crepidotus variabilis TaxID=179855 RepID=A0A9P6JK98_9AGAR|nr:cytidylyltransferase family-domain-containing protein [Crepidotus variabilis]
MISSSAEPAKLTKSAIKRAQRLARIERKRRERVEARAKAKNGDPLTPISPAHQNEVAPEVKPEEVQRPEEPVQPVVAAASVPPVEVVAAPSAPEIKANGITTKPTSQDPLPPSQPPKPVELLEQLVDVPAVPSIPELKEKLLPESVKAATAALVNPSSPQDAERVKKRQNALTRTLWSLIMIGGFIGLLLLGHAYMIILVILCQTLVYREVTALFSLKKAKPETRDVEIHKKDPWSKTLNWYFFAVTNYFLYGESIIYYFKHVVFADANLLPFATNHRIISFTLYTIGFMGFVMSLKKGYLKQQFGLFCWVHMSLLLIVVSSHFIVNNILEGLIWFWVPASLVICNDCFAYIWGITVGRTPLIKLSPKKTVEGFVGAFVSTVIFAVIWGTYFMRFDYMTCTVQDLGVNAFSGMTCKPNPVFVWRVVDLWPPVSACLSTLFGQSVKTISYAPYQIHLLTLACFASLVAPFGGFFASGFKRAFDIKDFGDSIPGHGGMTDRMDCQFLMGVFTYVYYSSLIRVNNVTVGGILQTIVSGLTIEEQLELIDDLRRYLESQGISIS